MSFIMVNDERTPKNKNNSRLSMRHSLMVWIAGAILGWVVAVVSVWTALNTTDSNIAKNSLSNAEQMEQIVPAAGGDKNKTEPEN